MFAVKKVRKKLWLTLKTSVSVNTLKLKQRVVRVSFCYVFMLIISGVHASTRRCAAVGPQLVDSSQSQVVFVMSVMVGDVRAGVSV